MKTPLADLRQPFDLSMRTYEGIARTAAAAREAQWQAVKTRDIPALNARLKGAGLPEITLK